ncbi:RidA family protein [Quadrisphaera oryzae]|uniref:RidA family protein n=1 Tax=Quadrisphaera TaxID=317661 RepID=UPI0016493332|nr:RidA family protein [Quadrisphaera sp. RL12-1S]MBC3762191.1 RidA family protein [Quadrisphaera sp. RL12-1S]
MFKKVPRYLVGRPPAALSDEQGPTADIAAQIALCWEDLEAQLTRWRMTMANVVSVDVRTTAFPAARAQADALGRRLRDAGARTTMHTTEVQHLNGSGATVEVEVQILGEQLRRGQVAPAPQRFPAVPEHLRAAVFTELEALRRGERPDQHHTVVAVYDGPVLIEQPDDIWEHPWSEVTTTDEGGWEVAVPLWTTIGSPSELTAIVDVDPEGRATLADILW